eukprot:gnl/Spiro4/6984_TR3625_c0_g1_i1.p1 gnl/Spiro4/6984_TR3625_c0_g1~~gnl/Spiro4/6984_TR3625_c0_g1_i1.p1  ORF type:complete len:404 (+),score=74.02 gnl/Spiro4/6984_TR3625_c0_g1_i1:113-1324(+)
MSLRNREDVLHIPYRSENPREFHVDELLTQSAGVQEVLSALIEGRAELLSSMRSVQEKTALLDAAIALQQRDVLTTVVLFLKDTCCDRVLRSLLQPRQPARSALLNYFRESDDHKMFESYTYILGFTDSLQEAVEMLRLSLSSPDPMNRLDALRTASRFCKHHADAERCTSADTHSLSWLAAKSNDLVDLLASQLVIEPYDANLARTNKMPLCTKIPRSPLPAPLDDEDMYPNLIFSPLRRTLYYCLLYHPKASENLQSSPERLRARFNVSPRTYMRLSLQARCRVGDWQMVKELPVQKGFFAGIFSPKIKSPISFSEFVHQVHVYQGPLELECYFASLIKDDTVRLRVSLDYRLFDIAAQTMLKLGLRAKLEELLRSTVFIKPEVRQLCVDALQNPRHSWKK